jgi:hypothetical protein
MMLLFLAVVVARPELIAAAACVTVGDLASGSTRFGPKVSATWTDKSQLVMMETSAAMTPSLVRPVPPL